MYWNTKHSHPISATPFILFPTTYSLHFFYDAMPWYRMERSIYTFNDEYSGCSFSISINSIVTDFILDIAPLTLATKIL